MSLQGSLLPSWGLGKYVLHPFSGRLSGIISSGTGNWWNKSSWMTSYMEKGVCCGYLGIVSSKAVQCNLSQCPGSPVGGTCTGSQLASWPTPWVMWGDAQMAAACQWCSSGVDQFCQTPLSELGQQGGVHVQPGEQCAAGQGCCERAFSRSSAKLSANLCPWIPPSQSGAGWRWLSRKQQSTRICLDSKVKIIQHCTWMAEKATSTLVCARSQEGTPPSVWHSKATTACLQCHIWDLCPGQTWADGSKQSSGTSGAGTEGVWGDSRELVRAPGQGGDRLQGQLPLGCAGAGQEAEGSSCSKRKSDIIWEKLSPWGKTAADGPRQVMELLFLEMLKTQLNKTLSNMIWLGLFWCCIFWSTFAMLTKRKIANEELQQAWTTGFLVLRSYF